MAGLFDFFDSNSNMSPAQKQAMQMGLLNFGAQLMQNSAPGQQYAPSLGGAIAKSLPAGVQAFQQANNQAAIQDAFKSNDPMAALAQINDPAIQQMILKQKFEAMSPEGRLSAAKAKIMDGFISGANGGGDAAAGGDFTNSTAFAMLFPEQAKAMQGIKEADPTYIKEKEKAKLTAKTETDNAAALPDILASSAQTLKQIEALKSHPGLSTSVGAKGPTGGLLFGQTIPGTDAAGFQAKLKQLKGGQFLQAYQGLKGGGAISEVEGEKAQSAIAAMDTAQSEKEFLEALNDYESIIKTGVERARLKAGVSISPTAPSGGGVKFLGYE